jgi:hypothetical protein
MNPMLIKSFLKTAGIIKTPEQMAAVDQLFSIKWNPLNKPNRAHYEAAGMEVSGTDNLMLTGKLDGTDVTIFVQCAKGKMPEQAVKLLTGGK